MRCASSCSPSVWERLLGHTALHNDEGNATACVLDPGEDSTETGSDQGPGLSYLLPMPSSTVALNLSAGLSCCTTFGMLASRTLCVQTAASITHSQQGYPPRPLCSQGCSCLAGLCNCCSSITYGSMCKPS